MNHPCYFDIFCHSYAENLAKLEKLVLVKFTNDSVVDPRGTEWFDYFAPGQGQVMIPMRKTALYMVIIMKTKIGSVLEEVSVCAGKILMFIGVKILVIFSNFKF